MKSPNAYKTLGMGVPLATLTMVIFWAATRQLHQNIFFILILVGITFLFSLILPHFFPHPITHAIQEGIRSAGMRINAIIVAGALVIVYVLGVGSVWVLSRIVGKRFMALKPVHSTWNKSSLEMNPEEMF